MSRITPGTINDKCQILSGGVPTQHPKMHPPKIDPDQLRRQTLETCSKMSSITPGTKVARRLREFISPIMSTWGAFGGLKSPN